MTGNAAYPLFSVSQYTTFPLSFDQDVALYRDLGIEAIEICEEKLSDDPRVARRQLAGVRDSGLKVTSVQPKIHSPFPHRATAEGDPIEHHDRMIRFRKTIDLFAECFPGEAIVLVAGGGIAPDFNFRSAHRIAREVFPPLADYAADRGMRIAFEHLSPVLMNAYTFICTLSEAMKLIEDVGRPNFGIFIDVWHVWREPDAARRIAGLKDRIFGFHVNDWPPNEPRSLTDRAIPGRGVIDLPALLAAAHCSGYTGAYCLELFSEERFPDSLWKQDPAEIIREGRAQFERAWREGVLACERSTL